VRGEERVGGGGGGGGGRKRGKLHTKSIASEYTINRDILRRDSFSLA